MKEIFLLNCNQRKTLVVVMTCGLFSKGGRLKISGIRPFPNNFHRNSPNVHVIYKFILKKHKTLISIGIWLLTSRFQSEEIKVFQQIIMKCKKLQIKLGQSQTTCKKWWQNLTNLIYKQLNFPAFSSL